MTALILLYAISIVSLAIALVTLWRLLTALRLPALLGVCIGGGILLYLASLVPGALAMLGAPQAALTLVACSLLVTLVCVRVRPASRPGSISGATVEPMLPELILLALPAPAWYFARVYAQRYWSDGPILSWDSVSYHLPGIVEYLQASSLYSLDGPYQTYGFGFDLIGGYPAFFFKHEWGALAAHLYAILFLFTALWAASAVVARVVGLRGRAWIRVLYAGAAAALVFVFHAAMFAQVGMSDLFQGACVLAAIALAAEIVWRYDAEERAATGTVTLCVLAGAALALAMSAKPTAAAYVLLAPLTYALLCGIHRSIGCPWPWRPSLLLVAGLGAAVGLVGGFFLLRNLAMIGALVAPEAAAWNLSVVANMGSPALYDVNRESVTVAASLATPFIFLLLGRADGVRTLAVRVLLVFMSALALIAFAISPYVIIYSGTLVPPVRWELRQSVILFALASLAGSAVATYLLSRILSPLAAGRFEQAPLPGEPRMVTVVIAATILATAGIAAPLRWTPPQGLPGYERLADGSRTRVYRWVQSIEPSTRIYSAGLRPYGLYGREWQHRVFYDLHSSGLLPEENGRARLAGVLMQFKPDLLLISVDPNYDATSAGKPLADWLKREAGCFTEIFNDEAVSGFRVEAGCAERLKQQVKSVPARVQPQA